MSRGLSVVRTIHQTRWFPVAPQEEVLVARNLTAHRDEPGNAVKRVFHLHVTVRLMGLVVPHVLLLGRLSVEDNLTNSSWMSLHKLGLTQIERDLVLLEGLDLKRLLSKHCLKPLKRCVQLTHVVELKQEGLL